MPIPPYAIGTVVIAAWELPSVELQVSRAYQIADRLERPVFPGGPKVWFYRMEGFKLCNVHHTFIKPAQGVCRPQG